MKVTKGAGFYLFGKHMVELDDKLQTSHPDNLVVEKKATLKEAVSRLKVLNPLKSFDEKGQELEKIIEPIKVEPIKIDEGVKL